MCEAPKRRMGAGMEASWEDLSPGDDIRYLGVTHRLVERRDGRWTTIDQFGRLWYYWFTEDKLPLVVVFRREENGRR